MHPKKVVARAEFELLTSGVFASGEERDGVMARRRKQRNVPEASARAFGAQHAAPVHVGGGARWADGAAIL